MTIMTRRVLIVAAATLVAMLWSALMVHENLEGGVAFAGECLIGVGIAIAFSNLIATGRTEFENGRYLFCAATVIAFGFSFLTVAIGIIPVVSFVVASLFLAGLGVAVEGLIFLRTIPQAALAFGLPLSCLILSQHLVDTDRPINGPVFLLLVATSVSMLIRPQVWVVEGEVVKHKKVSRKLDINV